MNFLHKLCTFNLNYDIIGTMMNKTFPNDMKAMHDKFGVHDWIEQNLNDKEKLQKFIEFRMNFIQEEFDETKRAIATGDCDEIVDGLIDICVVALGTLDAFGVDAQVAWNRVHNANMAKERGIKPERPNPLGLPDLMKPEGWTAPTHNDNTGHLPDAF